MQSRSDVRVFTSCIRWRVEPGQELSFVQLAAARAACLRRKIQSSRHFCIAASETPTHRSPKSVYSIVPVVVVHSDTVHQIIKMPAIRLAKHRKPPPDGFEDIEDTLLEFANKMKDAENAGHEGKKKHEMIWPIFQITHQRRLSP